MLNHQYKNKLENVFDIKFTEDIKQTAIEWDSLVIISFMNFMLDQFNLSLSPNKIESIKSFNELFDYLDSLHDNQQVIN